MDETTFIERLDKALAHLLTLTASFATNTLSKSVLFWIEPSGWESHEGMTEFDDDRLELLLVAQGKSLTKAEVVALLCHGSKAPLWINMTVRKATLTFTFCHLWVSRRFRDDEELYHQAEGYPPFHIGVPIPPTYSGGGDRFDINWQVPRPKSWLEIVRGWLAKLMN